MLLAFKAKKAKTSLECFDLFFTNKMIDKTVVYTNVSIKIVLDQFVDTIEAANRNTYFRLFDQIDIKSFLEILYFHAALGLNHESSHDIFATTMPWNRFHFLCKVTTFDEKSTRNYPWKNDKFACMRELFEMMNKQNTKRRFPSSLLAVDETL